MNTKLFIVLLLIVLPKCSLYSQNTDSLNYDLKGESIIIFYRTISPLLSIAPVTIFTRGLDYKNLWIRGCKSVKVKSGEYKYITHEFIKDSLTLNCSENKIYIIPISVIGLIYPIKAKIIKLNQKQTMRFMKKKRIKRELKKYEIQAIN